MNEIQHKFIEMLDTYQQCFGSERDGDSYCYLGLAYELYRKNTQNGEWTQSNFQYSVAAAHTWLHENGIPVAINRRYVTALNDQEHWTFADSKRALLAKWGEK